MKANTPVERLYNGIIKENPTCVLVLGYVSDSGCNNSSHKRYRYGTYHYSGSGYV